MASGSSVRRARPGGVVAQERHRFAVRAAQPLHEMDLAALGDPERRGDLGRAGSVVLRGTALAGALARRLRSS